MERPKPWSDKYRPLSLGDIVGNRETIKTLKGYIKLSKPPKMIILWGPAGTGKTSTAYAFVRDYYINKNIFDKEGNQIVGAFNPIKVKAGAVGIDELVEDGEIFEFMRTRPPRGDVVKWIIFDESEAISRAALLQLRPLIERFAGLTHVIFTTNVDPSTWLNHFDPQLIALRDRARIYYFQPLSDEDILVRLREILTREGVTLGEEILRDVVKKAEGSVRSAIDGLEEAYARAVAEEKIVPVVEVKLFDPSKPPESEYRRVERMPFNFVLLNNGEIRVSSEGRFLTKEELRRRPELLKEAQEIFLKPVEVPTPPELELVAYDAITALEVL